MDSSVVVVDGYKSLDVFHKYKFKIVGKRKAAEA